MLWLAHAPNDCPEAAYVFLLPVLIWFYFRPSFRKVAVCALLTGWMHQVALVGWMRHVSPGGMLITTFLLSLYQLPWFLLARAWIEPFDRGGFRARLLVIVGLSCFWVAIDWLRSSFTLGFPWCPLSVTQWERPVVLQTARYAGGWSIAFFLVFFNLCIGSYAHHLLIRRRKNQGFFNRSFCPELYLGILLLLLMTAPFFLSYTQPKSPSNDQVVKIGVCQPYLTEKWESGRAVMHKETLRRQTEFLSLLRPDLILWPEASTPYALNLDRAWVEQLSKKIGIPLLVGSVIQEDEASYNSMVYVDPQKGMNPEWYAKQILVPFGEYVPFPFSLLPGLRKLVGPVGNFSPGNDSVAMELPVRKDDSTAAVRAGLLICYEDIFPSLSRNAVAKGARFLIVSTNDAWFGEEGCAEQHAAHSVLRAVESGVPVVRCSNSGWSGWIDGRGFKREVLLDRSGSVYFQGASVLDLVLPAAYEQTVGLGDRFAVTCFILFLLIFLYDRFFSGLSSQLANRAS